MECVCDTTHQCKKLIPVGVQRKQRAIDSDGGGVGRKGKRPIEEQRDRGIETRREKNRNILYNHNRSPHNVRVCAHFIGMIFCSREQDSEQREKKDYKECRIFDLYRVILTEWLFFLVDTLYLVVVSVFFFG